MTTAKNAADLIFDADTIPFSETATLAADSDDENSVSIFSVGTEMLDADDESVKVIPSTKNVADAPTNKLYTITHEIGSGGYGSVWYGLQTNLKRQVALKSLKMESSDPVQQNRIARLFRQEALTTAYLQHPNVVPVYDLADDEKGSPIVAMKLVEGRQWNRVLAEDFTALTALEFLEKHLQVLICVANAVAYAHSKGIIHRDLKPSQVMIGNYGEVLLMDWGLAMASRDKDKQISCDPAIIVDAQSPLIKPLMPAGTPGYMAPEQTEKDENKLGPRTDVFLLGAILYELLTGYRPHTTPRHGDPFAAARTNSITRAEVCTPERDIPGQLSNLAMRAMATKPADRVATAADFARELKEYMVRAERRGESMGLVTEVANSVIAEDHTYSHLQMCMDKLDRALAQWPQNQMATYLRHQVLATFARMALASHDLKFAKLQAERLNECHERTNILREIEQEEIEYANQDAMMTTANELAQAERERAEKVVRFMLLDLQTELRSAGRADLVFKVATEALQFFESLHDDEISPDTLHNRCIAYQQIGNVLSEHGRRSEAETALKRADELANNLMKLAPAQSRWKKLVALCLSHLGRLHYSMGRVELAKVELYKCLEMREGAIAASSTDMEAKRTYALTLHDVALVHWREQDLATALEKMSVAIDLTRTDYQLSPTKVVVQSDLAMFLSAVANIYRDMGRTQEAMQAVYEALALRIALSEQFPGMKNRADDVYWVRSNLGLLQLITGDFEGSIDNLKHDLSGRRRNYEQDESSVIRNFGITFQLSVLAEAHFLLGKVDEAERHLAECLVHSRKLAKIDDCNPTAVSRHAHHLVQMAELLVSNNKWNEAQRIATEALEKARYSYWLSPKNSVVLRPMVQSLALCARIERRQGKPDNAKILLREAKQIFEEINGKRSLGEHRALQARLQMETGDRTENAMLLKSLESERRFDPYLKGWAQELSIVA